MEKLLFRLINKFNLLFKVRFEFYIKKQKQIFSHGFDFFDNDPNAGISVPFVPCMVAVVSADDLITFACCMATALGAGWSHFDFLSNTIAN